MAKRTLNLLLPSVRLDFRSCNMRCSASRVSDIRQRWVDVRFTPESGHCGARSGCPLCAISGYSGLQRRRRRVNQTLCWRCIATLERCRAWRSFAHCCQGQIELVPVLVYYSRDLASSRDRSSLEPVPMSLAV